MTEPRIIGVARVTGSDAARRWREGLDAWRIPAEILAGAEASPWTLPVSMFAGRARRQLGAPSGMSYEVAADALPQGGTVLDVGAGTGAASLALRRRAASITAVDENASMLASFVDLAAEAPDGAQPVLQTIEGRWPEIAPDVLPADVVVCHHVLYNVPDLNAFVRELTEHARSRVVVEITVRHPAALLNPLWSAVHGIERPVGPNAADAVAVISGTGVEPHVQSWRRPITQDGTSYAELVDSTCRRLCVGPDRRGDVEAALRESGVRPDRPYIGPPIRDLVTIWWDGTG